jgi:hypothetical protein
MSAFSNWKWQLEPHRVHDVGKHERNNFRLGTNKCELVRQAWHIWSFLGSKLVTIKINLLVPHLNSSRCDHFLTNLPHQMFSLRWSLNSTKSLQNFSTRIPNLMVFSFINSQYLKRTEYNSSLSSFQIKQSSCTTSNKETERTN